MKTLILLLSVIFILCSGCGDEEAEGREGTGEAQTTGGAQTTGEAQTTGGDQPDGSSTSNSGPTLSSTPSTPDPCAPYVNPCKGKECDAKYNNCLKPKAGDPTRTEIEVCTKEKNKDLILTLNEWDAKSGSNNLLCEFFEDEELYQFATNEKSICKNDLNKRKKELIDSGYICL